MATFAGEGGSLKYGATTPAAIAQVTEWSLDISKGELKTTALGSTFETVSGSIISGSGSCKINYDNVGGSGADIFAALAVTPNDPGSGNFELYTTGTEKVTFDGLVTGYKIAAQVGNLIMADVTFKTNGAVVMTTLFD